MTGMGAVEIAGSTEIEERAEWKAGEEKEEERIGAVEMVGSAARVPGK